MHARERLKEKGLFDGARVILKATNTEHTLNCLWMEEESNLMAADISPMPKLGFGKLAAGSYLYAHELEAVKVVVRKRRGRR